ncbi:hypothetical protein JAAARDRAFT_41865 [Jaapia argillacea MUCL 33604]|uniref:F-box domain-containing protein n=1 Tax=Jaapia argillacea MUCL 33604 TaxID=933084 RepID=A0A067P793_9AGAM|nr:hypothetical protein JAAARDRAFT_41865 [Jaapia argillacea MUCL 33604]
MITDLPDDILFIILQHIELRDLGSIRLTCRSLNTILDAHRSLWVCAMEDVLSISPGPPQDDLTSMPLAEMKRKVLRAGYLDETWSTPDLSNRTYIDFPAHKLTKSAHLIPGGEWVVEVFDYGVLRMRTVDPRQYRYSVLFRIDDNFRCYEATPHLALSAEHQSLFVVVFRDQIRYKIHVYRLDTSPEPQFSLLTEVLSPRLGELSLPTIGGNLLAFLDFISPEDAVIVVRRISGPLFEQDQTVLRCVSCTQWISALRVISERHLLIHNHTNLSTVDIPDMISMRNEEAQYANPVIATFTRLYTAASVSECAISPVIWSGTGAHQTPIFLFHPSKSAMVHVVDVPPDGGPRHTTFLCPRPKAEPCGVGTRRSVFVDTSNDQDLKLFFLTMARGNSFEDWEPRWGTMSFPLQGRQFRGQVPTHISYDEATGRMCFLLSGNVWRNSIFTVDVQRRTRVHDFVEGAVAVFEKIDSYVWAWPLAIAIVAKVAFTISSRSR